MAEVTCLNDAVIFEAKRKTAKFCSEACRKAYGRKNPLVVELEVGKSYHLNPNPEPGEVTIVKIADKKPYDREKNLQAFIKMGVAKTDWISTGIPEFDELTQIPRGRITQIQGAYAVGKTTLCLNMIKGLRNRRVLYIDSEAALNPDLLVDLELDPKYFTLYNESSYLEDIAELIREAAKSGEYELIVLDSVPMTSTKTINESDITASNIGQKAKILHKLMEWIAMDLKRTNTAMVFINQEREVIGSYVPQKYTPGGTAIPFQASLIIALKSIKSWRFPDKPKDNVYLGQWVEATIIKSKVNKPWRVKKFKLFYPDPVAMPEQEMANGEF